MKGGAMDLERRIANLERRNRLTSFLLLVLILTFGVWAYMWRMELRHVDGYVFIRYDRLSGEVEKIVDIRRLRPDKAE
jgi:hypothetical protein